MSVTFTKLFSSITESTVWCEPDSTRIVWITMLAMADSKGRIWASIPGLANRARVTVEQVENALLTFKSPDRYSRTSDNEGRRVEDIEGGWRLLNHEKYRGIRDEESIKESKRRYINERRKAEREAKRVEQKILQSNSVDRGRYNAEADKAVNPSCSNPAGFDRFWALYPRKVGKAKAIAVWNRLKVNGKLEQVLAAVEAQKKSEQWTREGGRFIPHPTTWLNEGRWDDEPDHPVATQSRFAGVV